MTVPSDVRRYGRSVFTIASLDDPAVPVFHGDGSFGREDPAGTNGDGTRTRRSVHRTLCGRILYKSSWRATADNDSVAGSFKTSEPGSRVHIVHAVKFARPCEQCWPPGADR